MVWDRAHSGPLEAFFSLIASILCFVSGYRRPAKLVFPDARHPRPDAVIGQGCVHLVAETGALLGVL